MNRKRIIPFLICIAFVVGVGAQATSKPANPGDPSLPEWVQLMYADDADIGIVLEAFEDYYASHTFEKNQHTQYLKRWLWYTNTYEYQFDDPSISAEDRNRLRAYEKDYLQRTKETAANRSSSANWTSVGPIDWDHDAASRSYAPGAAHVYTVEHCRANPAILYAGTSNAGVWKSTDRGANWTICTQDLMINQVYAIEVDHTNPNIVYASLFSSIYKTIDGGVNWSPTGDASFQGLSFFTRDIRMHPSNQNILFAATDDGFFKSINAGLNWTQVMSGKFMELEFHPTNSDIVYLIKQPEDRTEFYKSVDGGNIFTIQATGWPVAPTGDDNHHNRRAEIAVTPDNPSKVYAFLTGKVNGGAGLYGIYISTDEGVTWSFSCCGPQPGGLPDLSTSPPNINTMAWSKAGDDDGGQFYYDVGFAVSPSNEDSVFLGGVNMWVSDDGGATFVCPSKWSEPALSDYVHADIHDIHYYDSGEIWVACDGGIFYSSDGGLNFTRRMLGIKGSDLWGFGAGYWDWEVMLGGAYHNGTLLKNGDTYVNGWICTDGGDGTGGFVNYGNNAIAYSNYNIKTLTDDRTVSIPSRGYNKKPFLHYTQGRSGEMAFHPNYYNHHWFTREDGLWKTEDDNRTATLIHDFGEPAADVEVSWADTNVIYVTTWPGYWDEKKVYKTTDGGQNWTEITPSMSLFSSRRYIEYDVEPSYTDPNTLWLARVGRQTNDSNKIFKSTDGGMTWSNITTSALDGEVLTNIVLHRAASDGLYIGTTRTVYYKNSSLSDWQLFNTGLPLSTRSRRLVLNYRTESIINGTNRSVWRSDWYESAAPKAEPSVDQSYRACARDTFYFADHSAMSETGAVWNWSFPGASYVSSTSVRKPKVVYSNTGTYDVSLTITDTHGSDSKSISSMVRVGNICNPDTIPGYAMLCEGNPDHAITTNFDKSVTALSISAWVKPNGIQSNYTGIVMNDGDAAGFNFRESNNTLGYHWPGGSWSWDSNLEVPAGEWSHVAMVATPSGMTLYLNGVGVTHSTSLSAVDITTMRIGRYKTWTSRNYNGLIDEVAIWDRALSESEIRALRHLTKDHQCTKGDPLYDASLLAYYQFNEGNGATVFDRTNLYHATFNGDASYTISSAPVGGGDSQELNVSNAGVYHFADADMQLIFPISGTYPNGPLVVSRLNVSPDDQLNKPLENNKYWIVNNYGANTFSTLESIQFDLVNSIGIPDESEPGSFHFYKRDSNAEGSTWGTVQDNADVVNANGEGTGSITFSMGNNISSFSQFSLAHTRGVEVAVKVFLEGPYTGGLMNDALRTASVLPTAEPYTAIGYNHKNGGGGESCSASVFEVSGDDAIVDWVVIELRDKADASKVNFTRAALLQRDGDVVDVDGTSPVRFLQANPDDYYLAVRHRNHLGIRTPSAITLAAMSNIYEFTSAQGQAYGTNPMTDLGGVFGMYAGNANTDSQINAVDKNGHWRVQNGQAFDYINSTADFNLDTAINAVDKNDYWRINNSVIEQL